MREVRWWICSFERGADGPILDLASRQEAVAEPQLGASRIKCGASGTKRGILGIDDLPCPTLDFRFWQALEIGDGQRDLLVGRRRRNVVIRSGQHKKGEGGFWFVLAAEDGQREQGARKKQGNATRIGMSRGAEN